MAKKRKNTEKSITEKKSTIGLTERVTVIGPKKEKELTARIDTGADVCSIDLNLAKKLGMNRVEKLKKIKSAHGIKERPVVRASLEIKGRKFNKIRFTLADRKHLRYKALIGKNILRKGFMIDPSKK